MNKRKLRMVYRRYLFSYSFEIIGRPELPMRVEAPHSRSKRNAFCRL